MNLQPQKDTSLLDRIIVGRVDPYIYAFTTQTVPNYLKVGETYRPVNVRLAEWSLVYDRLRPVYTHTARIDDNTIFRDYAVHDFLVHTKHKHRLEKSEIPPSVYYSSEFFQDTLPEDVDEAIADIQTSAINHDGRYPLYTSDHLPKRFTYQRGDSFTPRANQQAVIDNFKRAIAHKRSNLLMFAAMRFGKSFTSMCCALEMGASRVLVVSAKADVKEEWKATVEGVGNFEGYIFAEKEQLQEDEHFLQKCTNQKLKVVLFLTLQDLQGTKLKETHKEVFACAWNLLLVDETHFGARANCYGDVLKHKDNIPRDVKDITTLDSMDDVVKQLKVRITIHLSGTPYRILMSSEFEQEDVIAFVPYTDIAKEQKKWYDEHRHDDKTPEWANPYFGFPEMVRFAFLPNQASLNKIAQLKAQGATTSFSELFRPKSLVGSGDYIHFCHEDVVLEFLQVIDGVKDDTNVLGFLNNERIKEGKLCRHMVMVLPYCASCDAMEHLLKKHTDAFRNLSEYQILNISGLGGHKVFRNPQDVKLRIAEFEKQGTKTITLTVYRMLTGNTVPQWDTMLFLRQSESPEEYDQAIFRLQNPYVDEYLDEQQRRIKFNLKPQTLLVDFDPERVFRFQERKSQIYNLNVEEQGNTRLKERIEEELKISPVITLDHNKLREVTATNILDAVRNYAQTRSVLDEALDIPVDDALLDNEIIQEALRRLKPLNVKTGFFQPPHLPKEGEEPDDVDSHATDDGTQSAGGNNAPSPNDKGSKPDDVEKRFAACYAQILFFAFLTEDKVSSLEEILHVMNASKDNKRLSVNLGLQKEVLKVIQKHCNGFMLSKLDYKIQNINSLIRDCDKAPLERVQIALTKFGRMSEAEIVTPSKAADDLIAMFPDNLFDGDAKVLDIASKQGEMLTAFMRRYGEKVGTRVYSICTSPLAYEFTRKVYTLLSLPIEHIYHQFTSFDFIDKSKPEILTTLKKMNFRAIAANPPYQDMGGSGGTNDAPLYQEFGLTASSMQTGYVALITPSRWFAAGRENLLGAFRTMMLTSNRISKLTSYNNSRDVFPNVEIKGGVCSYLEDHAHNGECMYKLVNGQSVQAESLALNSFDVLIREPKMARIVTKVLAHVADEPKIDSIISADTPFGIPTNPTGNKKKVVDVVAHKDDTHTVQLHYVRNLKRMTGYVSLSAITKNAQDIDRYKVYIPEAGGSGNDAKILGDPIISLPGSVCSQTYLYVAFDSYEEADAFAKYLHTRFLRFLVASIKITQHALSGVYRYVPIQDFTPASDIDWTQKVSTIDKTLYEKYSFTEEEVSLIESMVNPM